jgi:hypothetical protein
MFPQQIPLELTSEEIQEIDFRVMGNLILNRTIKLSHAVNNELLEPISEWLDDPHFLDKHVITIESDVPNWAEYKKRQRQWTKQQKTLAAERLRHYWQEIQRKRRFQRDLKIIFNNAQNCNYADAQTHKVEGFFEQFIDTAFLSDLLAPFSPIEKHRTEIAFEFHQAYKLSISDLLPWKNIIISEITESGAATLNDMKIYLKENKKLDKISKFRHLLQMVMDGEVSLEQVEHAGQIQIVLKSANQNSAIKIKDKFGQSYNFDWSSFNGAQRNKIITDTIERKILCRSLDYK